MNKKNFKLTMAVMAVSVFCFLGLTQSSLPKLSIKVSTYPWDMGDNYPYCSLWADSVAVADIENYKVFDWSQVIKIGEANTKEMKEITVAWQDLEPIIQKNIFQLTRIGICKVWTPGIWEIDFELGEDKYFSLPNALAIRKMLLDAKQETMRKEMINKIVSLLKSPQIKKQWEQQRKEFLDNYPDAMEWQDEYTVDYVAMQNTTYEQSLMASIDEVVKNIDATEYNLKVLPTGNGWWEIVRITNDIVNLVYDNSPLHMKSVFYRMGKEGSTKLKNYITQTKMQFGNKK